MSLLLTFARWLGLRGAVALVALVLCGVLYVSGKRLETKLALSEAHRAALVAQLDFASELAADFQARAERAVADKVLADQAAAKAAAVRARKWSEIRQRERAWSETPVPQSVVEGLR